ncbi:carboxylesterase/lipase family protein [Georgenia deserti]|uniref:Carboxylic ester hydrolase n=1 Tax=Georgenia deserti TaxID=2093781 RepID=A0ABW4LBY4_9MICO
MPVERGEPVVVTDAGAVRGFWRDERGAASAAFLGIPFAAPPVGELRFGPPRPHPPWQGVQPATAYGPTPQRVPFSEVTAIPEPTIPGTSTLNVNVFTPTPDPQARLPVLVWIHGGGFVAGSPASPWYDGRAFNRDGVVTVTVSYRLGFEGFGWIDGAPPNRGVLDWLAALEWVQRNVAAFGGNPDRVTIAGQSAGGAAVLRLLTMPAAQHLFHGVIGASAPEVSATAEDAAALTRRVAGRLGVEPTREGFAARSEAQIIEVQSVRVGGADGTGEDESGGETADAVDGLIGMAIAPRVLGPVIDGDLVPGRLVEAMASGVGADKPLLLGTVANEFTLAPFAVADALGEIDLAAVLSRLGLGAAAARAHLERWAGRPAAWMLGQAATDLLFRRHVPTWAGTRQARVAGRSGEPTWVYDFAWLSPTGPEPAASHCLDLPFAFDALDAERVSALAGPHPPQELADAVHGDWVSMITTGRVDAPSFDSRPGTGGATVRYDATPRAVVPDGYAAEARLGS